MTNSRSYVCLTSKRAQSRFRYHVITCLVLRVYETDHISTNGDFLPSWNSGASNCSQFFTGKVWEPRTFRCVLVAQFCLCSFGSRTLKTISCTASTLLNRYLSAAKTISLFSLCLGEVNNFIFKFSGRLCVIRLPVELQHSSSASKFLSKGNIEQSFTVWSDVLKQRTWLGEKGVIVSTAS